MSQKTVDEGLGHLPIWKVVPMALGTIVVLIGIIISSQELTRRAPSEIPRIIRSSFIGLAISVLALTVYSRVIMRRPLRWFMFTNPDRSTIWWTVIGFAFPGVIAIANILVQNGEIVETVTDPQTILVAFVGSVGVGVFTGIMEEVIFRGILYRLLEDRWNAAVAILVPAIVFSFLHTGRADSQLELWLVVTRVVLGGIMFGLIVYQTRNLWNAIAVHAGWNFLLGAQIVTIAEPGGTPGSAIINIGLTAPDFFGISVSYSNTPVTIFFLIIACVALLLRFDERIGIANSEMSQ